MTKTELFQLSRVFCLFIATNSLWTLCQLDSTQLASTGAVHGKCQWKLGSKRHDRIRSLAA